MSLILFKVLQEIQVSLDTGGEQLYYSGKVEKRRKKEDFLIFLLNKQLLNQLFLGVLAMSLALGRRRYKKKQNGVLTFEDHMG
jgi:hypothetical protein